MIDITAQGIKISIKGMEGGEVIVDGNDFSSNNDPYRVDSNTVSAGEPDLNGRYLSWRSKNVIVITLNLIPGSKSDIKLRNMLYASRMGDGDYKINNLTITYPTGLYDEYMDGRLVGGTFSPSVTNEGRFADSLYIFEMMEPNNTCYPAKNNRYAVQYGDNRAR